MIVVGTDDFELYHGVVNELRDRGVAFTTVEAGADLPEGATVLVVGPEEVPDAPVKTIEGDPADPRGTVDAALAHLRDDDGRTVVGVDPGERPGIAVLEGDQVVAAFQVPEDQVVDTVREEVESATDPLVRVGDGARLVGARLIDDLDIPVELVDERGTTPYLGTGARGMDDVLAAVNIARREGRRVTARQVEPTRGELDVIKARSREASETNREIDDALARRVAAGDLSLADALAEHERDEESEESADGERD